MIDVLESVDSYSFRPKIIDVNVDHIETKMSVRTH